MDLNQRPQALAKMGPFDTMDLFSISVETIYHRIGQLPDP